MVILTTSQAPDDVRRSYRLRANAYVAKPVGIKEFTDIIDRLQGFWFSVVVLPPSDG